MVIILLSIVIVFSLLFDSEEKPDTSEKKALFLSVKRDMDSGSFLEKEDIYWVENNTAEEIELDLYFSKNSFEEEQIIGSVVRNKLKRGQMISINDIRKPGEKGFLSSVLRPGMRAVSIPVDNVTGISNLVSLGDYVDVLLTLGKVEDFDLEKKKENSSYSGEQQGGVDLSSSFQKFGGKILAQKLRVIAVNKKIGALAGERIDDKTSSSTDEISKTWVITLEAKPEQVNIIAVSRHIGTLSLSLRNPLDDSLGQTEMLRASDLGQGILNSGPVIIQGSKKVRYTTDQKNREKTNQTPDPNNNVGAQQ